MTLHFVHLRSLREDAIPLLIMHRWPGASLSSARASLSPTDILDTTSLYYLTNSFASSVMIYNQPRRQRAEVYEPERGLWRVKTKVL